MGPCYYEFPRWKEAGLLQPIDTTKLKNWNKISPTLRNLPGISAGPGKVWFVPHYWGNTSITFRTDLAPEYVKKPSWNILFDPKYKGRVSVMDGVDDTVPFIAQHDRHRRLQHDAASNGRRCRPSCARLIQQARFVSSDDTQLAQGLASGEIVAAMSWRVTYATLHKEHKPVAYMNPPGGMFTYVCGLVMHKNPSNEAKALALIDSSLSDEAAMLHDRAYRRRTGQQRGAEEGAEQRVRKSGPAARRRDAPEERHLPAAAEGQGKDRRRLDGDPRRALRHGLFHVSTGSGGGRNGKSATVAATVRNSGTRRGGRQGQVSAGAGFRFAPVDLRQRDGAAQRRRIGRAQRVADSDAAARQRRERRRHVSVDPNTNKTHALRRRARRARRCGR